VTSRIVYVSVLYIFARKQSLSSSLGCCATYVLNYSMSFTIEMPLSIKKKKSKTFVSFCGHLQNEIDRPSCLDFY
jgi:hypothetical protein